MNDMNKVINKVFQDKPMVILAASPGKGGAASVLALAKTYRVMVEGKMPESLKLPVDAPKNQLDSALVTLLLTFALPPFRERISLFEMLFWISTPVVALNRYSMAF